MVVLGGCSRTSTSFPSQLIASAVGCDGLEGFAVQISSLELARNLLLPSRPGNPTLNDMSMGAMSFLLCQR